MAQSCPPANTDDAVWWCIIPVASTVASDVCPSSLFRAPSIGERDASAVSRYGIGISSLICSLSADGSGQPQCWAVVQLVSVTSVWPALLLMLAAVSHRFSVFAHSLVIKSDAYMCKCGRPLSLKPSLPLVRFCPHSAWPSSPLSVDVLYGWPLKHHIPLNLLTCSYCFI